MIKVENVSMKFRMNNDRVQSLKEYVVAAASGRLKHKDFWVFRDVDFEVEKGEVVGIIGRNGAGKSTLLKIISGILAPTCGRVKLGGRIVPMLELGSGFDVELTGRENIFLNGSILGYSESFLKEKYNEIVAFSELGDFIETPIRNYSSGMMMRLAFSIATVVQPEILIVDEILAVGDEAFQKKSKRKMLELMGGGTTVLFVSHSIVQIREMCSRVIWLENGRIKMEGETKYVCDKYQEALNPHKEDGDRQHKASDAAKNISDVLFIYGDDENAYEWRVTGQREQLLAGGVPSNEIYEKEIDSEEICWNLAKLYRVFICVNCKNTPWICRFVRLAKNLHKKVLFDFSYCAQNVWENPQEQLFAELKAECGGIIVSNRELAGRYEQYGCPVFYNPLIVRERTAEYASWAVYDRDVLPFCDPNALSEEELVNYNRAVLQKRKRQADGKRIGIFAGTWDSRAFHVAGPVLAQLLDGHKDIMLLTDLAQELFKQEQLPAGRILEAESGSLEELLRCYAQADAVLLVHTGGRQQDRLMQGWLYASFVKVPCFYMDAQAQDETLHGSGQKADWPWLDKHVACSCPGQKTAEDWAELLYRFLDDRDMRLEMGASAYESARNRHSSVDTGGRIGRHIRSVMQPNIAFLVSLEQAAGSGQAAFHHAAVMFRQGFDVTILVTGEKQEDIASDGVVLPAVSRDVVYSYQYFDTMAGFDWNSARWMQNYANAGRRIFFVSGYEPDYYKTGNMARLEAAQMYLPHVPMEFAAVSSWCRNWLKQDYGQEAALLPNGTADAGSAGVEKSKTVKKILILGDCGNEAEHLQEAFCIVDGLDKRFYEICFYHYGEHLPASCPYQNACVSRTQKELQKIYKDCDIMLETSRQISGRTAPLAVMAAGGAVVAARDRANPDYLDEGRNCVMYEPGDVEGARRCIQKLSEDTAYVKQLIENGRHTAEQYSWKQIDPKITAFYQVNTSGAAAEAAVTME